MPNIKSAKKRVLVSQKKSVQNRSRMSELKTAIKKFNFAIDTNNIPEAEKFLPEVYSIIDSAHQKGIIHTNNAANKKSALAKRLSNVKSGKLEIVIKKDNKTIAAEKAAAAEKARELARLEFQRQAAERKARQKEQAEAKAAAGAKSPAAKTSKTAKAVKAEKPAEKEEAAKKPSVSEKLKTKKAAPAPTEEKPAKAPAAKKPAAKKTEEKTEQQ